MSDVEMVLQRNWEQRRWAEEVEAEEGCKVIRLEEHRSGSQEPDRSAEKKAKNSFRNSDSLRFLILFMIIPPHDLCLFA